ncbi:hypothetical protein NQ315_016162 [Exocentrus adspersus]|uniref:Peptidase S1 domain-containing protein n=1 Tax=Exocentrus adspersus TaxID=1586481 RepID=A0AAV8VGE5_9CUCU|nr:hypothetical protein NQ315_016162 [Exocentrus adspersus]
MPAIYISKYNRFVDNVIGRINRILGKSYDPVRVKLQTNQKNTKQGNNNKNKINKGKKKNSNRKSGHRGVEKMSNKMGELEVARASNEIKDTTRTTESESREPAFILISKNGPDTEHQTVKPAVVPISQNRATTPVRQNNKNKKKNTIRNGSTSNKNTANKNNNKTKQQQTNNNNNNNNNKNKQRPRATLFGLSSIRRDGDVTVNMMSDHTTVKTNFILGPLTLRVERDVGKGARREIKSATATTEEMYGRLNLRIVHGGAATLHSIRVLQPKQVRVDSPDNHDKTREYIWKRSAHIASVVSKQLAAAAKADFVVVVLGAHDLTTTETTQQRINTTNILVHENYTDYTEYDIAVINTAIPIAVQLTPSVQRVKLAPTPLQRPAMPVAPPTSPDGGKRTTNRILRRC